MQKLKPLDYKENYTDIVPEGSFRISPSMISKFSDKKLLDSKKEADHRVTVHHTKARQRAVIRPVDCG